MEKETYYQKNKAKVLARQKRYYQNNREKRIAYAREYQAQNHEKVLEGKKRYGEKNKEKRSVYYIAWYAENGRSRNENYQEKILEWGQQYPERKKIHKEVRRATLRGEIVRPKNCSKCSRAAKVQAHHLNYDHFMNFVWLCGSCHKKEHLSIKTLDTAVEVM